MRTTEQVIDDSEIVQLVKGRRFTRNFDPVMECTRLDAEEKLILAEVISYRVNQKNFFKSLETTASRLGVSRSTVKRRMERLRETGFVQISVSRRNFNQTNVVRLGPATLDLFRDRHPQTVNGDMEELPPYHEEPTDWEPPPFEPDPF